MYFVENPRGMWYNVDTKRGFIIMNKQDLIKKIAEKAEVQNVVAGKALDAVAKVIEEVLLEEGRLAINGLGTFEVKERAERTGCNPKTGEKINIPACKTVAFKPAAALKEVVNK